MIDLDFEQRAFFKECMDLKVCYWPLGFASQARKGWTVADEMFVSNPLATPFVICFSHCVTYKPLLKMVPRAYLVVTVGHTAGRRLGGDGRRNSRRKVSFHSNGAPFYGPTSTTNNIPSQPSRGNV